MNYRLQSVSRLTLVFILAVVVSGSILTYFGINNISNQKELTEKRILEEEQELVARFSLTMQNQIESVTDGFQQQINPTDLFIDSLIKSESKHEFIQQAFLLSKEATFLYPNFSGIPETQPVTGKTGPFNSTFTMGETAEFRENNLIAALRNYQSALKYGRSAADSAKVLIALARVSLKAENIKTAVQYYIDLISTYSELSNSFGIPYVNFALQQFSQVKDTSLAKHVLPASLKCLEKMEHGEIPLTYQTKEILARLSDWVENSFPANDTTNGDIKNLISSINRQIDFVYSRRNEIIDFIQKNNGPEKEMAANRFLTMNSTAENPTELILLKSNSARIWGFLIYGDQLFETVLKEDFQKDLEFQYNITFPVGYNNNHQQYLTSTALLSPYFNQQFAQIQLTDESALQNIIKRRSWIYGIASLLLLVAMLLGVYLILRDIAREKRMARLRSDFISNVTHELKTPLTSIYMFAESLLLRRVKNATTNDEYLSVILKESERLKRMINNILEFSKAEKGIPEYHFKESNVSEIVHSAIHEMDYWFEQEQFEVHSELDKGIVVKADSEKLKQAFVNLIGNAIKYSNSKKHLDIRLYKSNSNIHIEFEDHGIGIPDSEKSRIFDQFYRADSGEGVSGTGLGLTVVKEIVEAHKGKIIVESKVGKGSNFSIILHQQEAES